MPNHQTMSKKTKPLFRPGSYRGDRYGVYRDGGREGGGSTSGSWSGGSAVALHLGHLWYRYLLLPSQTLTAGSGLIETPSPGVEGEGPFARRSITACRRSVPDGTSPGISPRAASAGWLQSRVAAD